MRALLLVLAVMLPAATVGGWTRRPAGPLDGLAFLAGCWERRSGSLLVEEQWMAPRGRVMLGSGRTTRVDSVLEHEQLRIEAHGDTVVYHAQPSGQRPAAFRLTRLSPGAVTFENPAHDFPQRISYRAAGNDSLLARVEGTVGGRSRAVDFRYARARCPG